MSLKKNKNKNKNKNKSLTKAGANFPAYGWQTDMEAVAELPNFFERSDWRNLLTEPPPGPGKTREELDELLGKQEKMKEFFFRSERLPEIEFEQENETPKFRRLLSPTPTGAYASTDTLIQAMYQLGTIVGCHYKRRFMRPRPSQLEPRLRPSIDVPGHAAYPSNHALQHFLIAQAVATVVQSDEITVQLFEIAKRVAENREYAGVHYASDTEAGKRLAFAMFPAVLDAYRETFQSARREWS
jgi:hypothetical protein